jgi:YHS domain-containing protein
MSKKAILGLFLVMAILLSQVAFVMAQEKAAPPVQKPAAAPEKVKATMQKTAVPEKPQQAMQGMPMKPGLHKKFANELAVCGCGMAFQPTPSTKFFTYNGKEYAVCSDGCYEMAKKDPAAVAKMADANMAKMMNSMPMTPMK